MVKNLLLFCAIFASCNTRIDKDNTKSLGKIKPETETIERIEIISAGGMQGFSSLGVFTKDSVAINFSLTMDLLKNYAYKKENTDAAWQNLIKGIDLQDFKKAVDGESNLAFDGIDTRIKIITNKENISKMNAATNKSWKFILDTTTKYYKK